MQTQENLQYSPEIEGNKQFRPPETLFQVDGNLDLEIEASMLVGLKISTGYTMTKSSPVWIGIADSHFQRRIAC